MGLPTQQSQTQINTTQQQVQPQGQIQPQQQSYNK